MRACSRAIPSARDPSRRLIASTSAWCWCCATSRISHDSGNAECTISRALGGANGSASACSSARPSCGLFASSRNMWWNSSLRRRYSMNVSMLCVRTMASSFRQQSRRGSSSSSDSSRSAARRAAVPSSTPRSSIASSMSVRVNSRTTKPPPGSVSRSPSCSSVIRAIRSGVRETPSSSTSRSSGTRSRGSNAPFSRSSRRPSVAFVVCEFAWLPRGTVSSVTAVYSRDGSSVGSVRREPTSRSNSPTMAWTTPCLNPRKIAITKTP